MNKIERHPRVALIAGGGAGTFALRRDLPSGKGRAAALADHAAKTGLPRCRVWLVVATSVALTTFPGVAQAASKQTQPGGGSGSTATLTKPYGAEADGDCALDADRREGRFVNDPFGGAYWCLTGVNELTAHVGSNNPLGSIRSFTATLHVARLHVPNPSDPWFYAGVAAAYGLAFSDESTANHGSWCRVSSLLDASERRSTTPVTIENREVTTSCSFSQPAAIGSVWGGVALNYTGTVNPVQIDATITKITVQS